MAKKEEWTSERIDDQSGKVALVTGANSGLGLVASRELARAGARVVLACRDLEKGRAAADGIRSAVTGAQLDVVPLDLASLASVREFASRFGGGERLDILINNAGVMTMPERRTADGFELQFATNHLGHFALTGLLMEFLLAAPDPRVVTVTSAFHAFAKLDFDDLQMEREYGRWRAYARSKLANLLFAVELDRRVRAAGLPLRALAAHPGLASTNLQLAGRSFPPARWLIAATTALFAQSAEMGALSILYAATHPELESGSYVGPKRARGYPKILRAAEQAYDAEAARRLWETSERLTGVHYEFARPDAVV